MTDMKNTEKQKWVLLDASSYMQRLFNKKGEKSSLTNFTVRSSEARVTPAFVSQIRLHLTGAIIHTRI